MVEEAAAEETAMVVAVARRAIPIPSALLV